MPKHVNPEIVVSALSKRVSDKGSHIDIQIFHLDDQQRWTLEIIDEYGGSTVWDEWFDTEQAALDNALRAVCAFGIDSFLEDNRLKPNLPLASYRTAERLQRQLLAHFGLPSFT